MSDPQPPAGAAAARPVLIKAAAVAMAAAQAPWAWIVADQFRSGAAPLAAWNILAGIAALAAAALLWKGSARASAEAPILCYYQAGFSLFWVSRTGCWPLWLGVAAPVAAIALLAAWRKARPHPAPGKAPAAADDNIGPWLKENAESVVVAFIMALVIRCFCIEVFKIPSSSMEPTLMGELRGARRGDRIMVTKYYYALSDIERFDVVVFKFPLNQSKYFIKRVVGLPDEDMKILDGDIYWRRAGEGEFRIARKSLRVQDSLWVDLFENAGPSRFLSDFSLFRDNWRALPIGGGRHAGYDIHDGVLATREREGARGVRFETSRTPDDRSGRGVNDLRIAFDFEITGPRGLVFAEVENSHGRFEVRLSTDEPGVLTGPGRREEGRSFPTSVVLRDFRISMDRRYRLDLSVFDGAAYARVDGQLLGKIAFIETDGDAAGDSPGRPSRLAFGAEGLTFRAWNLTAGRDVCYRGKANIPEGEFVSIPQDKYVMMGDNVANSHDSRLWTRYVYPLKGRSEPVECEGLETTDGRLSSSFLEEIAAKHRVPTPAVGIKEDRNGNEWALYSSDNAPESLPADAPVGVIDSGRARKEPFRFIDRRYIVGKAFWVWWPPGRWGRLIR